MTPLAPTPRTSRKSTLSSGTQVAKRTPSTTLRKMKPSSHDETSRSIPAPSAVSVDNNSAGCGQGRADVQVPEHQAPALAQP